ncbi:rCG21280 [Rattus norvegicus]|uniref:RCG21280 n=1 Tax=Rattus norvegicus TaxID=10116 RepID=A6J005_RAT|nr:rCG21280 [Rattus norvegicus]
MLIGTRLTTQAREGSGAVTEDGLEPLIRLPPLPECWNYRPVPPL